MKLPDPFWEAFPSLTPYHFAYNNPISFHDNSGLAPEKEKGDKVQVSNIDLNSNWESEFAKCGAINTSYESYYSLITYLSRDRMTFWQNANILISRLGVPSSSGTSGSTSSSSSTGTSANGVCSDDAAK